MWADGAVRAVGGRALVLAPLAVAAQTAREGLEIGIEVRVCRDGSEVRDGINVTNYDRLHRFDPGEFSTIVLDESSCIKHHDSKRLALLLGTFGDTRYRLCATATPAPNDWVELGTHSEFLDAASRAEMLAEYFVHDSGKTQDWRLKGHARAEFWQWVSSWAALVRRPSDLGYLDDGYELPPLTVHKHVVGPDAPEAATLTERRAARRLSIEDRVTACAAVVLSEPDEQWLVWGELNAETELLTRCIGDAVEIRGPDDPDKKEEALLAFAAGKIRVLVSKPKICGWGLNFQKCARMAFVGISDSFESYYQAVRRCWRFGQSRPVDVHLFSSPAERAVLDNLERKEADARAMADALSAETRAAVREEVRGLRAMRNPYEACQPMIIIPSWGIK